MGLAKRIGKSERLRGALCWLVAQYIRLVWVTGSWRVENGHIPVGYWDRGQPFILAFWHGRLLMMTKCWQSDRPIHMLISQHRDGQLIARTVAHFGIRTIEGSTTRGGSAALRAMFKALKAGECIGITPDGPTGPRMHASDGIVSIAKLSGCPIIPASCAVAPRRLLNSWDRFQIPRPFGRGVIIWGEPILVPCDANAEQLEQSRQQIEAAINVLSAAADRAVGQEPVVPA